jgi:hypothetical protein
MIKMTKQEQVGHIAKTKNNAAPCKKAEGRKEEPN